ncbi:MAG: hypothetical protein DDG60_14115 [Anaerolineae bacterium]|nr:MAG: hypothetical protein DDG60_14115 [Anaerolineae bacterium]
MITLVDYKAGNLTSVRRALTHLGIPSQITADPDVVRRAEKIIFPGVGAAGAAMSVLRERGLDAALKESFAKGTPILGICIGCQIILEHSEEDDTECLGLLPGRTIRFFSSASSVSPSVAPSASSVSKSVAPSVASSVVPSASSVSPSVASSASSVSKSAAPSASSVSKSVAPSVASSVAPSASSVSPSVASSASSVSKSAAPSASSVSKSAAPSASSVSKSVAPSAYPLPNPLKIPHMGWNAVTVIRPHPLLAHLRPGDEFYFVHSYYPQPADLGQIYAVSDYGGEFPVAIGKDNLFAVQFHTEKSGAVGLRVLENFSKW